jgi:hypothetical protein
MTSPRTASFIDRIAPITLACVVNLMGIGLLASGVVTVINWVGFGVHLSALAVYGIPAVTGALIVAAATLVLCMVWVEGRHHG